MKNSILSITALIGLFFLNVHELKLIKNASFHDLPREKSKHVRRLQRAKGGNTFCSGFNVTFAGKNYIMTNRHCCDGIKRLKGKVLINDKPFTKIVKTTMKHDLCAIEADFEGTGLILSEFDSSPLDKVILMGHPRGLDLVVREGRIITEDEVVCVGYSKGRSICNPSDRVSATAYGGNSGSPVLNRFGKLVGVLYAGSGAYPHEPFIVPYEYLREFLKSL